VEIMPEKILITPKSYYDIRHRMEAFWAGFEVIYNDTGKALTEAEMAERIADVDGLLVGIDPVSRRVVEKAGRLRAISKYGAGIDNIDLESIAERKISLKTTPGANSVSVAELTLGLLFLLARNIWESARTVKEGGWKKPQGIEITGKTIGLVGCGNIGREVALRAKGLCMTVLVYDPYFHDDDFMVKHAIEKVTIDELLTRSDFVSLHLPLTEETKGIIDRPRLEMMNPGSHLINTARGELIDEDDLLWALKNGRISGAACDVLTKEPPGSHPLLKLDNFILTPHMGANTREAVLRTARAATDNLIEMLKSG